MSVGIRGKQGEMEVLKHIKRFLTSMEQSNDCDCRFFKSLENKVGFKFAWKGIVYEISRPDKAKTESDDLVISSLENDYFALIQIKNIVSRAVTLTHVRSFIEKLIEEDVDDGLFLSLSSPVRGDLLELFNIDYSPKHPDDSWRDGIELFFKNKVGTKSIKKKRNKLHSFHKEVDAFFNTRDKFRFRDFPIEYSHRLPWLLGFRVPTKKGLSIHFSPSVLFHHEDERYLFFIIPKDFRMDIVRSWRLQQLLLNAKKLFIGIPPGHPFIIEKKLKKIKFRLNMYGWEAVSLKSTDITLSPTPFTIDNLSNFDFFNDNLNYLSTNPFKKNKFSISQLPPCIQNAYSKGVSDGRYHSTLLLSFIKDLVQLDENDKQFFEHFSDVCYEAANRAMLAKKRDNKINQTRKTRYFPLKRRLKLLRNLPCNHDGGIWMGPRIIDKIYHQKLCQPDEICKRMGDKKDVVTYLEFRVGTVIS